MRSRILDFLTASISNRKRLDHSFDHLQSWTTWKQCDGEHPKASISDEKAPKTRKNHAKNRCRFVWEHDVAGSNPVIPTKNEDLSHGGQVLVLFWVRFQSSMYAPGIPNLVSPVANVAFRPNLICHRRQNTVVFNCRIRCPSELGLLLLQDSSSIFLFWRKI